MVATVLPKAFDPTFTLLLLLFNNPVQGLLIQLTLNSTVATAQLKTVDLTALFMHVNNSH